MHSRRWFLAAGLSGVCSAQLNQPGKAAPEQKMSTPETIEFRKVNSREQLPPATAHGSRDCLRPYANERLNSRLAGALPRGQWKIRWRASIPASEPFLAILRASGRTVLTGRTQWLLFDEDGRQLANQQTAGEDAEIELQQSLLYEINRYSNVAAHRLVDGAPEYRFQVEGTSDYARSFLHRQGASMVLASYLRALNPMSATPARVSALEVYEFLQPVKMDEDQLVSVEQKAIRHYEVPRLWTAIHGGIIVAAFTNKIEFLDTGLHVRRTLAGTLEPQGMSLDEAGRLYVLAQSEGTQSLWMISHKGEALLLPLPSAVYQRPPVIGYDHTVYLLGMNSVTAVAQDGKISWTYTPKGRVAGAMSLPPSSLLVAAGGQILELNAEGNAMVVHDFAGESLTTSPVLFGADQLLATTQNYVYCLSRSA